MFEAVPVSRLRSDLFQLLARIESGGRALTLTRNGEPVAVLLSHQEYERLIDTLESLCDPDFFSDFQDLPEGF
jgi:prevent-host-death family protein